LHGDGVLVDVRSQHDGILLFKDAFRLPYELIVGSKKKNFSLFVVFFFFFFSFDVKNLFFFFFFFFFLYQIGDRGVDEIPGTVTRAQLLESVSEADLDAKQYHEAGAEALERVQLSAANPSLDHAGAQQYLRLVVKLAGDLPALADALVKGSQEQFDFSDAGVKEAYAKGKATRDVDDYITAVREAFERFLSMKPYEHNRFQKPLADAKEREASEFSRAFLSELRPVFGSGITHVSAVEALKKRVKPDTLKSNKQFLEFFSGFARDHNKAIAGYSAAQLRKQTELTAEQTNYLNQLRTNFAWYLNYSPKPTKEQLAAHLNDQELARRAGRHLGNMGNHAETRMRDLAKQAVTQLPQQRPLYLVCHAQAHSDRVAAALSEAGVGDVRVVAGGVDRWLVNSVPTDYTAAQAAKVDEALKTGMRGAPTGLSEIND
jgi:rhodanese-related sulfurtransferase